MLGISKLGLDLPQARQRLLNINGRHLAFGAIASLIIVSLAGCGMKDFVKGLVDRTTTKTVNILDDGIRSLDKNSADWQTVMEETRDKLIAAGQSTIANEVSNALNRSVAVASVEARCDVDFLRTRLKEDLVAIKAHFLHHNVPPRAPALCNVVPSTIDLGLDPTRRNKIEIFGYNFDSTPGMQLFLDDADGSSSDVSTALARPTHYHMTVDLAGTAVQLKRSSQRFHLRWGDQELSTIAVQQPSTPFCETKTIDPVPPHDVRAGS